MATLAEPRPYARERLLGLIMHLITDLTYVLIDPRIDFETREV